MSGKIILLLIAVIISFGSTNLKAQPQSAPIARVKYKISDYKNPSVFKGRYGLTRFSPDDKMFAVVGENDRIIVYKTENGEVLQAIKYGNDNTIAFSFGADGKSVLFQDRLSFSIEVWDLETGKRRDKIEGRSGVSGLKSALVNNVEKQREGLEMSELPMSPDGKNLLVARTDSRFDVVDLASGAARFNLEQTSKTSDTKDLLKILFIPGAATTHKFFHVSNAAYNSDGKRIALANGDKAPTLWDAETGKMIAKLEPQYSRVYEVSFSRDGQLLATADEDGITKIWDAATGANLSTIGKPGKSEIAYAWSPRGDLLATMSSKEKGNFYDARTGKFISGTGKMPIRALAFSPDGRLVATFAKKDKTVLGQIIGVADGAIVANLPRPSQAEQPLALEWSADGKLLAISSVEYVKIFNARGELLQSLENAVFPAHFSHDSQLLLTGGKNDDGFIWQIEQK